MLAHDNISNLRKELSAWEVERNTVAAKVNWQFRPKAESRQGQPAPLFGSYCG